VHSDSAPSIDADSGHQPRTKGQRRIEKISEVDGDEH
jgi:hypothetical protein